MKKFISLLLVFVMCLSLFSACAAKPKPSPSLSPEEVAKLEIESFCDEWNNISANGKNYRRYVVNQNTTNKLFYVIGIVDVNNDKVRTFYYGDKKQTVGFGDTVDENGTHCFSSIQAILDLGLFSVKVEDSFYYRFDWDEARYTYTWLDAEDNFGGAHLDFDSFVEYGEIFEFSESTLIHKSQKEIDGRNKFYIITHIGKVPDFDTAEIGYVETKNPLHSKENIEKVTIIPDPNK